MAYQKLIILGNIGKDISLEYTPGGTAVAKFSVAVTEKKKDGSDDTQWFPCKAFGKTGETISKFFGKGDTILLDGKMNFYSYEKDGQRVFGSEMLAFGFSFCGKTSGQGNQQNQGGYGNQGGGYNQNQQNQGGGYGSAGGYPGNQNGGYPNQAQGGAQPQGGGYGGGDPGFTNPPDDDIPF